MLAFPTTGKPKPRIYIFHHPTPSCMNSPCYLCWILLDLVGPCEFDRFGRFGHFAMEIVAKKLPALLFPRPGLGAAPARGPWGKVKCGVLQGKLRANSIKQHQTANGVQSQCLQNSSDQMVFRVNRFNMIQYDSIENSGLSSEEPLSHIVRCPASKERATELSTAAERLSSNRRP